MTASALFAQCGLVSVFVLMTGNTTLIVEAELVADVAALAGYDAMHADQWKLAEVVIEATGGLPVLCRVAGAAE